MFDKQLFQRDPRSYALELVDAGLSAQVLLEAALQFMSHDEVRDMLDANELSPRFDKDADATDGLTDEDVEAFSCPMCGLQNPTTSCGLPNCGLIAY